MSAANYCTMKNFSLFVRDTDGEVKRCPECGAIMDTEATVCDICGCEELEECCFFDDLAWEDDRCEIERELVDINCDLMFHKITLRSGYYSGVQFYVEAEHDLDEYDYDNDECHYYFDCCRSVAHRKYETEKRKINRKLAELGKRWGFQEVVCTARFSNGEAWFEPVSNPRARLKAAVA
ncbi:hypothetical protein D3Z52_02450 [Clostridiaceae bacterium]|nr:hypothetical protein [Clostridiaceae bacterium]